MKVPFVDLIAQYESIKEEIDTSIKEVIEKASFIGGAMIEDFERDFAQYQGVEHCVSCANGTDALEIALLALDIGPGHEVIVPAATWVSTASAVHTVGATPVFVDVDPDYYTMDPEKIEEVITEKTRALIPVHFYGLPADVKRICEIAERKDLSVIEDCAQAHGADIEGTRVGGFGEVATFSFYPAKNLGAYGDAGCILARDADLAEKCRITARLGQKGKYNHVIFGRNSRMDSIQGSILRTKLKHLDNWISRRRNIAVQYGEMLDNTKVKLPQIPAGFNHVFHLYVIQSHERDGLKDYLKDCGISTQIHYPKPVPTVSPYNQPPDAYPVSDKNSGRILSLPMYPELDTEQVAYVAKCVNEFHREHH